MYLRDCVLIRTPQQICLFIEIVTTQAAIEKGFGLHLTDLAQTRPQNILPVAIIGQVGLTFTTLATTLSKISFAVTMTRLTEGWWLHFVHFSIAFLSVLMIPAIVLPWAHCTPLAKTFDESLPGTCIPKSNLVNYGLFETGTSLEVAFAAPPFSRTVGCIGACEAC